MFTDVPLRCSIDLSKPGKQFGSIDLFVSDDQHSYASIPIPIVCIANGSGPTVLVAAGNHGNEAEGQVVVRRLIDQIQLEDVSGRLFLLPAMNLPAVRSFTRVSPLDRGNLNRSFPGRRDRGPTSEIAHYLTNVLLPQCDAGIDLHSGGPHLRILPSAYLGIGGSKEVRSRSLDLAQALALPYTLVCSDGDVGMDDAAHANGVPFVSTEFGGGSSAFQQPLDAAYASVIRMLQSLGCFVGEPPEPQGQATVFLDFDSLSNVQAPISGLFRPCVDLGQAVKAGDCAGLLYSLEEVDRAPLTLVFPNAGTVAMARASARVTHGEYIMGTAPELSLDAITKACST